MSERESHEEAVADVVYKEGQKEVDRLSPGALEKRDYAQDIQLKKKYATSALVGMGIQLAIADLVFIGYAVAISWQIPSSVMQAWLAATVIQVVAVVLVITRSLFPGDRKLPRA